MIEKIQLNLVGITYNQIESGVYAVILEETEGDRRLPIIIGSAEAQSIECRLQNIVTPRPLTHDLMANVMRAFGQELKEVILRRLDSGIFAADLVLTDGERSVTIDSRSSDAIGLAIRMGAPIYTSEDVMQSSAISPENGTSVSQEEKEEATEDYPLSRMSDEDLEKAMIRAAEEENYELASRIKSELQKRKK